VLTKNVTELHGTVNGVGRASASESTVVVYAEEPAKWTPQSRFIASVKPDKDGRFNVRGLPSGNYLVAALDFLETGEEYDPGLLRRIGPLATAVTLIDGQSSTTSVTIVPY
jgi:hypothetical protein